jgi:spore maturation protein CgeB
VTLKILLAHSVHAPGVDNWYQEVAQAAGDNLEVRCCCISLNPPSVRLSWPQLDWLWKTKNKDLMSMYERLQQAAADCDVLLNYNGINLHPEFLDYLPTFNVFSHFDDPESSTNSAPVAASYDAVFYGNIASRFQYEHWGCQKMAWLPIFVAPSDVPPQSERETVLAGRREVDIVFVGGKTHWRQARLNMLGQAFPQARLYGTGWENGRIDEETLHQLYAQAKIGWNVHNSTGPINRRLFTLAGSGVFQICDNKTGLGQIFTLDHEVIGFDTIPEAIEATRYYLEHDDERREIAANAYQRFWKDYHAGAIWQRIHQQLQAWGVEERKTNEQTTLAFPQKTMVDRLRPGFKIARRVARPVVRLVRRVSRRSKPLPQKIIDERAYLGQKIAVHYENSELRDKNVICECLPSGNSFERPDILALNWTVTSLIGKAKRIIEIGSGTGPFAEFASLDPSRTLDCFEEDDFARNKALTLRSRKNVRYFKTYLDNLANSYDLLVSVEVIEHIADLKDFLGFCASLAPRAIFTTPNRAVIHDPEEIGPPAYPPHVREFTPGEIYWILKFYYKDVFLYYMPDVYVPWLAPMTITTQGTPIIAECIEPL